MKVRYKNAREVALQRIYGAREKLQDRISQCELKADKEEISKMMVHLHRLHWGIKGI